MLAAAVTWSKQDMADLTQQADNLEIRPTEQGTVYPAPVGSLPSIRFEGAGFPDYPWMFATDQEYTMFALLAAGQFTTAEDGLRSLAAVSDIANNKSGKVVHETVTDGSVYFGLNDEKGDIDETAKFPDAVAMVWRWTGDSKFRDDLYDFSKRNMQYMVNLTTSDDDIWPDGSGNVEASGLGAGTRSTSAVYTIRGLLDLADMAASKHDVGNGALGPEPRRGDGSGPSRVPGGCRASHSTPTRSQTPPTRRTCSGGGPALPQWKPSCTRTGCSSRGSRQRPTRSRHSRCAKPLATQGHMACTSREPRGATPAPGRIRRRWRTPSTPG